MELMDARTKFYLIGVAYFLHLVNGDERIQRSDISTVLGGKDDPNFWPSRGRRNNLETKFKQYLARKYTMNTSYNGKLEKPLYVDEPMWLTIDRRAADGDDDYFWVTRGRRANNIMKHTTIARSSLTNSNHHYSDDSDNEMK